MVVVVGQGEVARKIDFDPMTFADGHRGHDVQEFVENLCRGLRGALRKSLPHKVGIEALREPAGSAFGDRSYGADGERHPKMRR